MTVQLKIPQEFTTSPIVALHSSASSGNQWKMLAQDAADLFEMHAPDLPGYGPVRGINDNVVALPMDPAAQIIGQVVQLPWLAIFADQFPIAPSHGSVSFVLPKNRFIMDRL